MTDVKEAKIYSSKSLVETKTNKQTNQQTNKQTKTKTLEKNKKLCMTFVNVKILPSGVACFNGLK